MAKKIYLIANWKMNPANVRQAERLAANIVGGLSKIKNKKGVEIILCPPFPFLQVTSRKLRVGIKLGAQNCHFKDSGAYTGEISVKMLKDLKCQYIIVGHSERRKQFGEDSYLINKKLKAVLKNNLTPVLAVGEREGQSVRVVESQLKESLAGIRGAKAKNIVVAYEPVWAIGTGKAASTDDAMGARIMITKVLSGLYSKATANKIPILYGGSTNRKNIARFIWDAGMDGALVGGSSLNAGEFIKMTQELQK